MTLRARARRQRRVRFAPGREAAVTPSGPEVAVRVSGERRFALLTMASVCECAYRELVLRQIQQLQMRKEV